MRFKRKDGRIIPLISNRDDEFEEVEFEFEKEVDDEDDVEEVGKLEEDIVGIG